MKKSENPKVWMRNYMRNVRAKRRAAGQCTVCGADANGKSLCEKHMEMQKANGRRYLEKKEQNEVDKLQ